MGIAGTTAARVERGCLLGGLGGLEGGSDAAGRGGLGGAEEVACAAAAGVCVGVLRNGWVWLVDEVARHCESDFAWI